MLRNILNLPLVITIIILLRKVIVSDDSIEIISVTVRIRKNLQRMGPTYVKLGQMLSLRYDIFPDVFCDELQKLLDQVEPIHSEKLFRQLEKDSPKLAKIIKKLPETPIGSASIAQVYQLNLDGEEVVLKLKRPGVDKIIKGDLFFITIMINLISWTKIARQISLSLVINQFKDWTLKELNFNLEASNIDLFTDLFKNEKSIIIPKLYKKYSNQGVIVMEYIKAPSLYRLMQENKIDPHFKEKVTTNLVHLFYLQNFEFGVFHGDPHPGNILIFPDGRIGLLDFGIIGYFEPNTKQAILNLFMGLIQNDLDAITDTLRNDLDQIKDGSENWNKFRRMMFEFLLKFKGKKISEISSTQFMIKVLYLGGITGIQPPPDLVLFVKELVSYDGVALKLDPGFNFIESFKPFIEKGLIAQESQDFNIEEIMSTLTKYKKLFVELPAISKKLERLLK